jgi:hypothetical protein
MIRVVIDEPAFYALFRDCHRQEYERDKSDKETREPLPTAVTAAMVLRPADTLSGDMQRLLCSGTQHLQRGFNV